MTQEEKDLLINDLCARMPYRTKIQLIEYSVTGKKLPSEIKILDYCMLGKVQAYCNGFRKDEIKPYLFPMSNMTEEQWKEYQTLKMTDWVEGDINGVFINAGTITDWLNKNHFDYRGLIEKGLAIDATNLNIYIEL